MKTLHKSVLAILSLATAGGAWALGCGGDDNGAASNDGGGGDGSTTGDSTTPRPDGGAAMEAGMGPDGSMVVPDAPTGGDASDAMAVLDAPQLPEAGEGGNSALYAYPGLLAQTYCERLSACCFPTDAGVFNMAKCLQLNQPYGYFFSNLDTQSSGFGPALLDGGNVTFNPTSAQACLNDIAAIDCTANVLTSAQSTAIYKDCYGAYQGTVQAGSACQGPIECAPGLFCDVVDAGGDAAPPALACHPVEDAGAHCGQFATAFNDPTTIGPALGETACSNRGSGNTDLFCNFADLVTGGAIDGGPKNWVCRAGGDAGAGCNNDLECSSKVCDPGANRTFYQCVTSKTFVYPSACKVLEKDGG